MAQKMYKNKIQIQSAADVRRLLTRVLSQLDEGLIDTDKARCFGYLADKCLKAIHAGELEERLEKLEELAENEGNGEAVHRWA